MKARQPCVLLVDSDRSTLTLLGDYLRKQGMTVYTEENAEDALARMIETKGAIDVLVAEIMVVRSNGWELLKYIRNQMQLDSLDLPIIVMSPIASVDLEMEYLRHRANDWLITPVKPMALLAEKIKYLLGVQNQKDKTHG